MNYNCLCRTISQKVKNSLVQNLSKTGWVGETLAKSSDLKSTHQIDSMAMSVILSVLKDYQCNVYLESEPDVLRQMKQSRQYVFDNIIFSY